jgi:predicted RNase H-like HicB family nuclease
MEELVDNLQDAIQGWLEVANEIQKPDPISQIIEIAV